MFKALFFVIPGCLLMVSCNKDSLSPLQDSYRVVKIISYQLKNESATDTTYLTYDDQNHLVKTSKYDTSGLISYTSFKWEDSKLLEIQQLDFDTISQQFQSGYHSTNQFDSAGNLVGLVQSGISNDTFSFQYSNNQLVKITSGLVTRRIYNISYLSGNVSSIVRYRIEKGKKLFIDSITYQYDGSTNPFHLPSLIFYDLPIHELVTWLSKNNLVAEHAYQKIDGELKESYSGFNLLQYTSYNYPSVYLGFLSNNKNHYSTSYFYDKIR